MIAHLPPEIIQHIINKLIEISFIPFSESKIEALSWSKRIEIVRKSIAVGFRLSRVSSYASVSKEWQHFIEMHTFRSIHVTSQELEALHRIVDQRRQTYIVDLSYTVLLPLYDAQAWRRQENAEEQKANSTEFTSAMVNLFAELKDWNPQGTQEKGMRQLSLACDSLSDDDLQILEQTSERPRNWRVLSWRRYKNSCVEFSSLEETSLAVVNAFTALRADVNDVDTERAIDPSALCILASRMPQLIRFKGTFSDRDKNSERRIQRRPDFAENLSKIPQGLQALDLKYCAERLHDQRLSPRCFESDLRQDPFSCSIRTLSQRLARLSLSACVIERDLFWPLHQEPSQNRSLAWPNLRDIVLKPCGILADGTWLFEKDPGYLDNNDEPEDDEDDEESEDETWNQPKFIEFRQNPVHLLSDELYLSMANAARNMPKLESLSIVFDFGWPVRAYNKFEFKDDKNGKRTILWQSPKYRPSSEVMEAWRTAKGPEVEITIWSEVPR